MMKRVSLYLLTCWLAVPALAVPKPPCLDVLPYLGGGNRSAQSPLPEALTSLSALERHYFLKPLPHHPSVQDLARSGGNVIGRLNLPPLGPHATVAEISQTLARVPVRSMLVKPGHLIVRDPSLVKRLSGIFAERTSTLAESEGKMVLDVVTDSHGKPLRVEVREAHHRLLAFHLAHPVATVADLVGQAKEFEWLLNGSEIGSPGISVPNKVPVHAVPMDEMGEVDVHLSKKAATFKTTSNNWELGSRASVAMAARATTGDVADRPIVAIHFIAPDLPSGLLPVHLQGLMKQTREFQQVILIPSRPPSVEELARLKEAVGLSERLNLYVAPLERDFTWPGEFYRDILRMRLQQMVAGEPPVIDLRRN